MIGYSIVRYRQRRRLLYCEAALTNFLHGSKPLPQNMKKFATDFGLEGRSTWKSGSHHQREHCEQAQDDRRHPPSRVLNTQQMTIRPRIKRVIYWKAKTQSSKGRKTLCRRRNEEEGERQRYRRLWVPLFPLTKVFCFFCALFALHHHAETWAQAEFPFSPFLLIICLSSNSLTHPFIYSGRGTSHIDYRREFRDRRGAGPSVCLLHCLQVCCFSKQDFVYELCCECIGVWWLRGELWVFLVNHCSRYSFGKRHLLMILFKVGAGSAVKG